MTVKAITEVPEGTGSIPDGRSQRKHDVVPLTSSSSRRCDARKFPSRTGRLSATRGLLGLSVAAVLVLTACSPSDTSAAANAVSKVGGTLEVVQSGDFIPGTILARRSGNDPWIMNVFQPLIYRDPDGKPQPLLATDWKFADDGLSVTLDLRSGVTFHTGRAMTAEDVKWTIETTTDSASGSPVGFIAKQFAAVEVLSPTSLKITFKAKVNQTTIFDYFDQTYIVDKDTYSGLADGSKVIGTGPYKWSAYKPAVSLELTRYDEYWDKDHKPYLDKITFKQIKDATAQISAVRSGSAGVAYGLDPTDAEGFANDPQYRVLNGGGTIYPFGVDVTKKPFDDVRVRQALAYAIDRERINKQVFAGSGTVTDLFWGGHAPGATQEQAEKYTYNPDKAKHLIQEAGATGADIPITVMSLPQIQSEYEIIANNLKAIGLNPTSVPVDGTTFASLQNQANLGPAFLLLHGQVGVAETTMLGSLPSLRQNNPSHFDSPEYQKLRQAFLTADEKDAAPALKSLTDYLLDQAWSVPILQAPGKIVVSNDVQGVSVSRRGVMMLDQAFLQGKP